jgi:integrase/recombinase XerD
MGEVPLAQLRADYLEDLEIRGRSPLTARNYAQYLDTFFEWLGFQAHASTDDLTPADITEDRLRAYRLFLARRRDPRTGRPVGAATRNLYQIGLRNFLRYCARRRHLEVPDPETNLELAKERDIEIRHLQREELERMLGAIDEKRPNGLRDRAIVEALFGTAVRVSELAAMTRRQVDLHKREVQVIGKGGKARLVLISTEAAAWIERYLASRGDDHPALFISKYRGQLTPLGVRRIQKIVEDAALRAGLPFKVSPHWLRHSRLTLIARYGKDLQVAQRVAGHASLSTTSRYLHVTDSQLRTIYDQADEAYRKDK